MVLRLLARLAHDIRSAGGRRCSAPHSHQNCSRRGDRRSARRRLTLVVTEARVRRLFAIMGAAVALAVLEFSGPITTWLARGQNSQQLIGLSGRENFWAPVLAYPRNKFQEIFGFGLSNAQFDGQPIDSNWIASYLEEGLLGVTICAALLVSLFVTAIFQHAAFSVRWPCSWSLTAWSRHSRRSVSPMPRLLLDMTLAASLLHQPWWQTPVSGRDRSRWPARTLDKESARGTHVR